MLMSIIVPPTIHNDIEQVTSFSIASKNQGDILVTGLQDGVFSELSMIRVVRTRLFILLKAVK